MHRSSIQPWCNDFVSKEQVTKKINTHRFEVLDIWNFTSNYTVPKKSCIMTTYLSGE